MNIATTARPQTATARVKVLTAAIVSAALCAAAAHGREPTVPASDLQPAEYVGVALLPGGDGAAVALRVGSGDAQRVVPIFIGPVEAAAIARVERGLRPPRPLTHELLADVMSASGLSLRRVVIDDLREGVFHATLELRLADAEVSIWVDARPSDSLALALAQNAPILLGPRVIESAPDWEGEEPTPPRGRGRTIETFYDL